MSPRFEVKISSGTTIKEIKEHLYKKRLVQFIITKNDDIWLSDKGHDHLMFADGLLWRDNLHRGYVSLKDSILDVHYYNDVPDTATKMAVSSSLSKTLTPQ